MNILAIDTTTNKANVTLCKNDTVIDRSIDNQITQSQKLMPLIDECLKQANLKIPEIDTFCIITGPGSFTGIRIGIATIKAFAKISNAKIFAVNSLECLAYETINQKLTSNYILSLLDAKNSRAYYALYKIEGNILIPVVDPANDIITDAIDIINKYFNSTKNELFSITVISDIIDLHDKKYSFNENILCSYIDSNVSSSTLTYMAKAYIDNTEIESDKYFYNYAALDATYVRPSQAERIKNGEKI